MPRNFDEKWLTGTVFMYMPKAFHTVWIDGLLYKLTDLNSRRILGKPSLPLCIFGCSKRPSQQHIHLSWLTGWRGSGWNNLCPPVKYIRRRHAASLPATSSWHSTRMTRPDSQCSSTTCHSDLMRWLKDAMLVAKAGKANARV